MNHSGGVRMKAYLIGALLSIAVIFMAHYSISIVHGSYLAIDHMPAGGVFVFFCAGSSSKPRHEAYPEDP